MHGDDVASAGVQIAGETAKETIALLFQYFLKLLEQNHQNKLQQQEMNLRVQELQMKYSLENPPEVHGQQQTLTALKKGGELSNISIPKEDLEEFKKANEAYDLPFTAFPIKDSEMVDLYFLQTDAVVLRPLLDNIVKEKLAAPDQEYKATVIDGDKAEAFQSYCAQNNISVNMLETKDNTYKCIYKAEIEMKVQKATEHINDQKNELANMSVEITQNGNKPQFVINDLDSGRKIRFNFGTKERFERALTEHMDYTPEKAMIASQVLITKMSAEQRKTFLSGSKLTEKIDSLTRDIRYGDDSILVSDFEFSTMKLKDQSETHLVITDKSGNMAVFPESMKDRTVIENTLRAEFGIKNNEQIKDMMAKVEKIGYAGQAEVIKRGEYEIKRTSKTTAEITYKDKTVAIDLRDRASARKILSERFDMSESKADKILDKANKQSATKGLLNKAKSHMPKENAMIKLKKPERGSRK